MNTRDIEALLDLWRLPVRSVVHEHNGRGEGVFALVFVGEGEGCPDAWLQALRAPAMAKMPRLEMAARQGALRLLLINDDWAKRLPRPEEYGCVTELRGYDEVGLVTIVRLAAPVSSAA